MMRRAFARCSHRASIPLYSRRMLTFADPVLDSITATIVDRFDPERVLLFGSRARGEVHESSDYDIMVVMACAPNHEAGPVYDALGRDHPIDVIVTSPEEFEWRRDDVGTLAYVVER